MAQRTLRRDAAHLMTGSRLVIGVSVDSSCRTVRAALVETTGDGLQIRATVRAAVRLRVDESLTGQLRKFVGSSKAEISIERLGQLQAELAEVEVEAIQKLGAEAALAPSKILLTGLDDPGWWCEAGPNSCYLPLCDAARVAEASGMNVVDSFPSRDLAQGGQGGPLAPLPQWILLKHPRETRLLVDLGRTTRMTFLPAEVCSPAQSRIRSFDVGPGTRLLDELAAKLTDGQHRFDPGGRFAVQGRRIDALLEHWLADYTCGRTLPRWHPRGIRPERFLNDALRMAIDSGWSVRDLLCTATHLIAETLARAVRGRLPDDLPIDRVIITGGGQHNGMLLRELTMRLSQTCLSPIRELGVSDDALEPACVALLALFHLDQVPGNINSVTGAAVPRVLGRLTPGSPQAWQRLLHQMAGAAPTLRPLRSAL